MEPTLSNSATTVISNSTSVNNSTVPPSLLLQQPEIVSHDVHHHTRNLYPRARHIILISLVLFSVALIIFLMHQNGKSIYDKGL